MLWVISIYSDVGRGHRMNSFRIKSRISLSLLFMLSVTASGQPASPVGDASASCREVVAGFYTWYVRVEVPKDESRRSDLALRSRPDWFSRELAKQLREDSDAQKKVGSDLVSLDADPFVG